MGEELNNGHWTIKNFKQRMTVKDWDELLLAGNDTVIYRGHITQLKARKLSRNVVEISKNIKDGDEG